jgi:hypothetical protein
MVIKISAATKKSRDINNPLSIRGTIWLIRERIRSSLFLKLKIVTLKRLRRVMDTITRIIIVIMISEA